MVSKYKIGRNAWVVTILMLGLSSKMAFAYSWDESAARRWSPRWREAALELERLEDALAPLPKVALVDHGGTGGLAMTLGAPVSPLGHSIGLISIRWDRPVPIDMVALVPAQNRDLNQLVSDYGLPETFAVELVGEDGLTVIPVAREDHVLSRRMRKGYPFIYPLPDAPLATEVRIRVYRLADSSGVSDHLLLMAFAECFCFSGEKNVARDAEVRASPPGGIFPHWQWKPQFLVDGLTPLGLPEVPGRQVQDIGWLSKNYPSKDAQPWVMVDLGRQRRFDTVRVFPVHRPSVGHIPGFGLPQSYVLQVSNTGEKGSFKELVQSANDLQQVGYNPVEFSFEPVSARYIQFKARKVWKPYANYPGFLALSEMQVLNGEENVALGATVTSSDSIGRRAAHQNLYWSERSLTDGMGPEGELIPIKKWLLQLDQRQSLERQREERVAMQKEIVFRIRKWGVIALAVLAIGSLLLVLVLPFRYRRLRRREIQRVRARIAGDLHDEVGSNLGCIQILSDLARSASPKSEELATIRRIAAETVAAVRDIVWLLRARTEERVCIIDHLRESGRILLDSVQWSFEVDESLRDFRMDDEVARNVMLFYREALHNLIRHAQARTVDIRLDRREGRVILRITDDGCGVTSQQVDSPTTLLALKQRAAQLNGELTIQSAPGQGMVLTLCFPV